MNVKQRARVLAFAACAALLSGGPAGWTQEVSPGALITKLLPAQGGKVCFAGTFDKVRLYSRLDQPVNKSARHKTHGVKSIALELEYDRNQPDPAYKKENGFDVNYTFRVTIGVADRNTLLLGAGECWRRDKDVTRPNAPDLRRTTNTMRCMIECDGGGMTLERVDAADSLRMRLSAHDYLRTSSCGSENDGDALALAARDSDKTFTLRRVESAACAASRPGQGRTRR